MTTCMEQASVTCCIELIETRWYCSNCKCDLTDDFGELLDWYVLGLSDDAPLDFCPCCGAKVTNNE
jgi:hypothetical protein